jgi:hypothetical protein
MEQGGKQFYPTVQNPGKVHSSGLFRLDHLLRSRIRSGLQLVVQHTGGVDQSTVKRDRVLTFGKLAFLLVNHAARFVEHRQRSFCCLWEEETYERAVNEWVWLVLVQFETYTCDRLAVETEGNIQACHCVIRHCVIDLIRFGSCDRTGYAEHFAQLASFLGAETNRELLCTVDRNRHGVFWQQVEVVLRNVVTFHHVNSFQAVERCGELEAFEGLCRFERYLELLTGFHVAVFDVEDGRVGACALQPASWRSPLLCCSHHRFSHRKVFSPLTCHGIRH